MAKETAMTFQLFPPKHDLQKGCYVFHFDTPPIFDCSSATDIPFSVEPVLHAQLVSFIELFLKEAGKYFSKQLTAPIFMQRLQHIWSTVLIDIDPLKDVASAIWIPAQIHFYATRYEIHWSLRGVTYVPEPSIPPGFLERGDDIGGEDLVPLELPGQGEGEEELGSLDAEAIPLSSKYTQEEAVQRAAARKRIRQARLRVALAQLRAERLAERYYRKYGDFEDLDDSNSELSEEEDAGELLRSALANQDGTE
jgi:hypothetical protein